MDLMCSQGVRDVSVAGFLDLVSCSADSAKWMPAFDYFRTGIRPATAPATPPGNSGSVVAYSWGVTIGTLAFAVATAVVALAIASFVYRFVAHWWNGDGQGATEPSPSP